eukprot:6426926-Alexandrium_andersonii.AAC.1
MSTSRQLWGLGRGASMGRNEGELGGPAWASCLTIHITPEISGTFHQAFTDAWQSSSMNHINTLVDTM